MQMICTQASIVYTANDNIVHINSYADDKAQARCARGTSFIHTRIVYTSVYIYKCTSCCTRWGQHAELTITTPHELACNWVQLKQSLGTDTDGQPWSTVALYALETLPDRRLKQFTMNTTPRCILRRCPSQPIFRCTRLR
jgi:hypothetical protein